LKTGVAPALVPVLSFLKLNSFSPLGSLLPVRAKVILSRPGWLKHYKQTFKNQQRWAQASRHLS
jgi:hypothetical protein